MSTIPYIKDNYGIDIYGCGLCQVGVSCENGVPKKRIDQQIRTRKKLTLDFIYNLINIAY